MVADSDELLELHFDYQSTCTISMRGNRMPKLSGGSIVNASDYKPKRTWQIGNRKVLRDELEYLQSFWLARSNVQSFRIKDWGDFSAAYNGSKSSGYLGIGNGSQTQFQLLKRYITADTIYDRAIVKPVPGTVEIYVNSVKQTTGYSVNYNTGVITFLSPPANGPVLTASFEFDVLARFTAAFNRTFLFFDTSSSNAVYQLPGLAVEEV